MFLCTELRRKRPSRPVVKHLTNESEWWGTPLSSLLPGCRLVAVENQQVSDGHWAQELRNALTASNGSIHLSFEGPTEATGSICRYVCSFGPDVLSVARLQLDWRRTVFAMQRMLLVALFSDHNDNFSSDMYDILDAMAARLIQRQLVLLLAPAAQAEGGGGPATTLQHQLPAEPCGFRALRQSPEQADTDAMASLQRRWKQCGTIPWEAHRSLACQLGDAMREWTRLSGGLESGVSLQLSCLVTALSTENKDLRADLSALNADHDSLRADAATLRAEIAALHSTLIRFMGERFHNELRSAIDDARRRPPVKT
eukprot:COSAG01_NODE_3606_length_5878_cov_276.025437_3_plen_313_part_00